MDNTINGRTPEEIKKGLECTNRLKFPNAYCSGCSYYVRVAEHLHECKSVEIITDALAYIQQLERERDSAVEDMEIIRSCRQCKTWQEYFKDNGDVSACEDCDMYSNWQWRGVQ